MPFPTVPVGRACTESRVAVDDGYIWPIERAKMVAPGAIRERMVEDIAAAVNDGGEDAVVTIDNLRRAGWTLGQAEAHAATAFAIYKAEHSPRLNRRAQGRNDCVRRLAAEAAALALFVGAGLIWAAHASGSI